MRLTRPCRVRQVSAAALTMLVGLQPFVGAGLLDPPLLESLRSGCRLEQPKKGNPDRLLWLSCANCRFILLGRTSLQGQVKIRTPEQALEFVRLFTTASTWYLGRLERMVEVTQGAKADPPSFVVPQAQFAKCCVATTVREAEESSPQYRWFVVQRTIVEEGSYNVYAITEIVGEDGRITTTERKLLGSGGRQLGVFSDPYIL
jgi:hypothetical protein